MSHFSDLIIHTKFKLCTLWASTMFCYIYCDFFGLYKPGTLQSILDGKMGPLGTVTQGVLLGTSILMAIPSLMVFLSVTLPARHSRILNIVVGSFFTLLLAAFVYIASWYFYKFFAAVETALTASIVWHAWKWPKAERAV